MKKTILTAAALLTAACVPSLHPLYTGKDLVFDPALTGAWHTDPGEEEKDRQRWRFVRNEHSGYTLEHTENGETRTFTVHLVSLGGARFLDLYPDNPSLANTFYQAFLMPVHMFARVNVNGGNLELRFLSDDWVKKAQRAGRLYTAHEKIEDTILLTAPTPALQQLIRGALTDPKAFPDRLKLRRAE